MDIYLYLMFIFMVILFVINFISYRYLEKNGYSPPLPFVPSDTFNFIALCKKVKNETNDKKLEVYVVAMYCCYFSIVVFLLLSVAFR